MTDAQDPQAQGGDPSLQELLTQVIALEDQVKSLTEIAARSQADLQNAKQRMEKDADELRRFALQSIVLKLLPTIDNFQRAFSHLPPELSTNDWVKGVAAIEQNLVKQITDLGVTKMEALGQQVDTARHEVVVTGPGAEGVILEVLEDGYEFNGKVVRPAKVKVGDGSAA